MRPRPGSVPLTLGPSTVGPIALGVLLALALMACAGDATTPDDQVDRLVVIDADGNIGTMAPDGTDTVPVTSDAGDTVAYFQPGWSPAADRLAYSEIRDGSYTLVVTAPDGSGAARTSTENLAFYHYWDPTGDRISWLRNDSPGEIALETIDPDTGEVVLLTTGAPLYYAWSPDGSALVTHVGEDRLETQPIEGGDAQPLPDAPGAFQAPEWTESGVYFAGRGATNQPIVVFQDGTSRTIATVAGTASFAVSPDGSRIAVLGFRSDDDSVQSAAYQTAPSLPANHLVVVDLSTGEFVVASGEPAAAFTWSPDGSNLAMLVRGSVAGTLRWEMWSDAETTTLAEFAPSVEFLRDVLPFFDQYARSLRLWSPDSTRIAFPGTIDGRSGIWVQDVAGGAPALIADGVYVAWSPK